MLAEAVAMTKDRMETDARTERRKGGRGSQLTALEQLAIMWAGIRYRQSARAIATRFGMHRDTVRRVFATNVYRKAREEVQIVALKRAMLQRSL